MSTTKTFVVFIFYFFGAKAFFSNVCEVALRNTNLATNVEHPLLDSGASVTYTAGISTYPTDVNWVSIQNMAMEHSKCVVTFYADSTCLNAAGSMFAHNGIVRSDIPTIAGITKCIKIAVEADSASTMENCRLSLFANEGYGGEEVVRDMEYDATIVADKYGYFSDEGNTVQVKPSSISLLSSLSIETCWVMVYGDIGCSDPASIDLPRLGAITGSAGVAQLDPSAPTIKCIRVVANEIASIPSVPTLIFHNPFFPSYLTISLALIVVVNVLLILATVWYCTCKTKRGISKYFTIPSYADSEIDNTENEEILNKSV